MPSSPSSLGRALFAGLMCGAGGGVAVNLVAAAISSLTDSSFPELDPILIEAASIAASVAGGALLHFLATRTRTPVRAFAVASLIAASLLSAWTLAFRPPGFAKIAIPVHLLLALLAIVIIPRLTFAQRIDQIR